MDTLKLLDVWKDLVDIKAQIAYIIKLMEEGRYHDLTVLHKHILEEYERLDAVTTSIYKHFHEKHTEDDEE